MNKNYLIIVVFLLSIIIFPLSINVLKESEVQQFKEKNILEVVSQLELYLKALIKEKQSTTSVIAVGVASSSNIIDALKNKNFEKLDFKRYSLELKNKTDFKNVWFQLIDKNGISVQRSWTDFKGDKISNARLDLQKMIKNPKVTNTISVGKFDMTFKSMIPIYDNNKTFLGIIEVITHFNSISKELEKKGISAVFLVYKRYKKQITKPFSKKFIDDYYVANMNVDKHLFKHLKQEGIDSYLLKFKKQKFYIDKSMNEIVSYHTTKNINGDIMSHILLTNKLVDIDISKLDEIIYIYNLYMFLSVLIIVLLFYFLFVSNVKITDDKFKRNTIFIMVIVYFIFSIVIYKFNENKYNNDIEQYKLTIQNQAFTEYKSIIENNKKIAQIIFSSNIDIPYVKKLFKDQKRDELFSYLESTYKQIKQKYNIRQLHFHLPNSDSFLRMHRPNKFGDSLIGIRQSVEYVNKYLKPYSGFEEGRIFNGYRYIFPLSYDTEHIGSVEISFDFYSFMDNYFNVFNSKRVNFLLSKEIIDKKVFEKEQSNYIASPIEGYYFDKGVLKKLDKLQRKVIPSNKNQEKFDYISKNIPKGNPFVVHFYEVEELSIVIPLLNELNSEVVGAITISKSDAYITQKRDEFRQLLLIILVILLFLMIFIYRELISKFNTKFESQRNQKILDSQNSFILITDGFEIKASNRSMLDFFGFETLEQFKKVSSCICDYFQKEEAIEYIQKEMEGVNWFEYIKNNMHENLKIKMIDKNNDPHIFAIEFSKFEGVDYIVSFLDITKVENSNKKLKNMEVQLVQSEKLASLGNMIGNIAHQWRQPLSVISTSASGVLVKKEYGVLEDKDLSDYMNNIMLNVNFLSDTIDTFRDFIKEDKEIKEINIQENIDIILKILAASLENNHIKIIKNIDYSKPIIKSMVSGELSQVISNLVNNAKDILVEKNIDNPQIKIVCKVVNNSIFITIQDNAGGVPEDIINKIFEPYFTTKHQSQGTGLGLYMSYKIVTESLNGKLYVKNENGGANFIIELSL